MQFEDWYRGLHPRLFAALLVISGDRGVASEAADEALTRALERWDRVQAMSSPEGWTYTVGVHVLRRRARRAAKERSSLLLRVEAAPELAPDVWAAVRQLTRRQQEAIALRYVLDLPEAEVARAMGVAVGTASATLAAARAALRVLLDEEENTRWS